MSALATSPMDSKRGQPEQTNNKGENAAALSEMDHATQRLAASREEFHRMLRSTCIITFVAMAGSLANEGEASHDNASIGRVAVVAALTLSAIALHHAAILATEPYHQGSNLVKWLEIRHKLSHIPLDWTSAGVVRARHLSAFEVFSAFASLCSKMVSLKTQHCHFMGTSACSFGQSLSHGCFVRRFTNGGCLPASCFALVGILITSWSRVQHMDQETAAIRCSAEASRLDSDRKLGWRRRNCSEYS